MDYTPYVIFALGAIFTVISSVLGWLVKSLTKRINDVEYAFNSLRVDIGTNYIRYDRLQDIVKPIMEALKDIQETLKTKADK